MVPRLVARLLAVTCALAALPGCAMVKHKAVGMVASTLASSGDVFTRDDDPELVGQAIPFGLKLYESLLDSAPKNKDLLLATCSNFTQYGVAYLETEALVLGEAKHHDEVTHLNDRALKLYMRARGYCLRAMEVRFPGIGPKLLKDPGTALAGARKADVPLLYWTAASWGSAIGLALDKPDISIDLPTVRALDDRAAPDRDGAVGRRKNPVRRLRQLDPGQRARYGNRPGAGNHRLLALPGCSGRQHAQQPEPDA